VGRSSRKRKKNPYGLGVKERREIKGLPGPTCSYGRGEGDGADQRGLDKEGEGLLLEKKGGPV